MTEQDEIDIIKINKLVVEIAEDIFKKLHKDIGAVDFLDEKQRWLVVSRVINLIYSTHYKLTFAATDISCNEVRK